MKKRTPSFKDERTLTERNHAKAINQLHKAEDALARAVLKWTRAREKVKRYDKRADNKLARTDWRELAKSADKIRTPADSNDYNGLNEDPL